MNHKKGLPIEPMGRLSFRFAPGQDSGPGVLDSGCYGGRLT